VADGVVVGSALVRLVEEMGRDPGLADMLEEKVRELSEPLRRRAERRRA
jgi:tryptophan synthase alpha subunit